jgi:transcriptional regulator with XRE-family HTH domain
MDSNALGAALYARRQALRLTLLDVNRRTGLPLLYLVRLERGEVPLLGAEGLRRIAAVLGFGQVRDLLWAATGEDRGPAPGDQPTASAAERFLRARRER